MKELCRKTMYPLGDGWTHRHTHKGKIICPQKKYKKTEIVTKGRK